MTLTCKLFHKKANVFIFCDSEFLNEMRIVWSMLICYNTKGKIGIKVGDRRHGGRNKLCGMIK